MNKQIYQGCYEKNGLKIKAVRVNYDPNKSRNIYDNKNKKIIKVVSNKGIGFYYSIKIIFGQQYIFDLDNEKDAFMVKNLVSGGKIKFIENVQKKQVELDSKLEEVDKNNEECNNNKVTK